MSTSGDIIEKDYPNEEITVEWAPRLCQHSALCWKGLIEVFNPRKKPWIDMAGSTTEKIIDQVKKCPSGALRYRYNSADRDKSS